MTVLHGQSDIIYHADPAIGSTTAKLWLESPRLLRDELDGIRQRKDSRAFQFGRAAHAKFTDPALFLSLACTGPINEKTGKPYGAETKAYTEWADANPGKIILGQRELADLHLMDSRMPAQVREILSDPDGVAESSIYVSLAGVAVKCRPDWISNGTIYDIKTIGNMADAEKHISRYKYWFSHAWYRMIVKAETGQSMPFRFIFAEKSPPYRWRIIDIDADWIGYADASVDRVLGEIAEAQRTGDWSDKGDVAVVASMPAWGDDAEFEDDEEGGISL
jgi:hypothetical protein